jgi:hypothetical protein
MKKFYIMSILATLALSQALTAVTVNDINQGMANIHAKAFGVNNLFEKKIKTADLAQWLNVAGYVKDYVMNNSKDLFGTIDPLLTAAAQSASQANSKFVQMIQMANSTRHYTTQQLITITQFSQYIADQMMAIREALKDANFILNRKKNAAALLSNFTLYVELTAKKAIKDARATHLLLVGVLEEDSDIPTPPSYAPVAPPTDMPPTIEEVQRRLNSGNAASKRPLPTTPSLKPVV